MTTEAAMSTPVRARAAEPHGRLTYLDGWRAIAVAVVIMSHVTGFRHEPLLLKQVARWLPVGEIGVLIFFFISGYVISRSALAEIEATGSFSQRAFYIRRAFRIIPPLVLYLVACLVLGAFGVVDFHIGNAAPAFLYVCNVELFNNCIWLGGHTWSLAYEEQFYMLFPILLGFFLLGRMPFIPHLIFALVFAALPLFFPLSYASRLDFPMIYCLFGMGFLAARYQSGVERLLRPHAGLLFVIAAAVVLAAPAFMPWPAIYNNYPLLFILAIPVMVLCAGWSFVSGFFTLGWLRYVGRISYGIYLWQELATSDLFRTRPLAVELAAVIGVVVLCAVLFEVMETPLIRLGRRLAAGEPARVAAPARGA